VICHHDENLRKRRVWANRLIRVTVEALKTMETWQGIVRAKGDDLTELDWLGPSPRKRPLADMPAATLTGVRHG
jgi:hypothetical protein